MTRKCFINLPEYIWQIADLKVPTIREEITKFSVKYRDKITTLPNELESAPLKKKKKKKKKKKNLEYLNYSN